jgi:hypothetical protein
MVAPVKVCCQLIGKKLAKQAASILLSVVGCSMTANLWGTKGLGIRLTTMTHASRPPLLSRFLKVALFGVATVFMLAIQSPTKAASPSAEIKEMFSKMDRQLCRSLSLANCKRLTTQKKIKLKPGKKAAAVKSQSRKTEATEASKTKPKSVKAEGDKASTSPVPLPVLKQAKREVVPVVPPPEKDKIPTPTLKPAKLSKEAAIPAVPTPVAQKTAPQKPPEIRVVLAPSPVLPPLTPAKPLVHAMPDGTLMGEACFDSLKKLGVDFTQPVTTVGAGVCAVSDAVQVQSITIGGAVVKLSDQPTFNCGFAFKFASWLKVEANPIVTKATGKTIATFGTGPGFQCRGRNGDMSAKLSEHAFGNAVDIERIKLSDGEVIDVKDALTFGAKYQSTLAALRSTACQYFTTVLGPGTNAAHATHFHFDLARRGKKGNHTMCQ